MGNRRIEYFDALRGIAILFVIAIHSFEGFDLKESNSFTFHLAIIWRQIIGCAVPIFLAISGYFLSKKEFTSKNQYFLFLKKQIPKIYLPMLVWSIPYFLFSIFSIYSKNDLIESFLLLLMGGFSVYYFITLITQYYLLLPILQKLGTKKSGLLVSGIVSTMCILTLFYLTRIQHLSIPLVIYAGNFPLWIVFFTLGIYLGKTEEINIPKKLLFAFTLFGLSLSIVETYLHIYIANEFVGLGIKFGAFIYSFTAILFLFSLKITNSLNSKLGKILVYIGKLSFGIYLTHMHFLQFLIRPLVKSFFNGNYFTEQILMISFTCFGCVVLIALYRKLARSSFVNYLGFN